MTDAEFVFRQDVKEKSITKRSAAKTNRTGKGPVKFPSDYLTKKEREKMNSEVIGMSCKKRYSFREFKAFSDNQKIGYINYIIGSYAIGKAPIAKMMGISENNLIAYLKKLGIFDCIYKVKAGGGKDRSEKLKQFYSDYGLESIVSMELSSDKKEETEYDIPIEVHTEVPVETNSLIKRLYPSTASFVINGLDMDLIHKIFEIFNPDNIESIDITIRSKEVV